MKYRQHPPALSSYIAWHCYQQLKWFKPRWHSLQVKAIFWRISNLFWSIFYCFHALHFLNQKLFYLIAAPLHTNLTAHFIFCIKKQHCLALCTNLEIKCPELESDAIKTSIILQCFRNFLLISQIYSINPYKAVTQTESDCRRGGFQMSEWIQNTWPSLESLYSVYKDPFPVSDLQLLMAYTNENYVFNILSLHFSDDEGHILRKLSLKYPSDHLLSCFKAVFSLNLKTCMFF